MTLYAVYNGASGGLGRHLGRALDDAGIPSWPLLSRLGDVRGQWEELRDLSVAWSSRIVLIQSAALVPVRVAEEDPDLAYDVNVSKTEATVTAFVEWATKYGHEPSVVFVSSSHVYAPPKQGTLLTEASPTEPLSVYAKTKLEAEDRLRAIASRKELALCLARVFGMIGPQQRSDYLLPGLIRRARTGDLSAIQGLDYVRDYLDARDIARHLASLCSGLPRHREELLVNVCSGEATRIGDILDLVLGEVHRNDPGALHAARGSVTAASGRPTDVNWAVGDPSLLAALTRPPIRSLPLATTVAEAVAATHEA